MTVSTSGSDAVAFAGRTAELSTLNAAADAAKAGRFSAVLISGEPGIGKTRLTEEAGTYATAEGFEVAAGRCFDTQSGLTYFPFIQAFGQLAKRPSPQTAAGTRRSGAKGVGGADIIARLAIPATGSARLTPEISSAAQTELFDSVVCFLRARSEICPVLVVLEDLDWADEDSLSLLLHLVRMLATARVLIIGTCRANETNQGLELGRALAECGRNRCCQRIRVKGLSETDAANLAERLLGVELADEAQGIIADIGRLTNGNPLFIHQIVRHLMEADRLRKRGGQSVFSSGWESKLAADDAIRDLVDGRLSGLSERCREVLSQAAVLGEEFEFEVLARMLRCGEEELADLMEEASGAGIIAEARSDQTTDFAFVHGLVRQSLYERQSRPVKRVAHADAAQAIEAVHSADLDLHLSQLALHYARAGRAGNLAKAAEYSMRAGETASAVGAYADAARHWRTALQRVSASDRGQRAKLTERLGEASLSAATPAEAAHHLRVALKLYAELGQEADAARVHARLVTAISLLSMSPAAIDVGQAVSHSRRAEKLLAVRADPGAEAELLMGEALVAHAQFRTEEGLVASERAIKIGQHLDNAVIWCRAAALHGHLLFASGKLKQGIGLMEQAVERAERTRDPRPRFEAAWLLSFSYLMLWDPRGAERTIEAALADAGAGQVEFLRQVLVAYLGIANIKTGALTRARSFLTMAPHRFLEAILRVFEGEWTQAENSLSEQIERSQVAQSKQQHWTASLWLARLKRVQGDDERALELLTTTPLIAESLLRIPEEITTRSELALVRLARGEIAEAHSEVRRCRALLTPGEDWRSLSAFVERADAAVLAHDGSIEHANKLWISAVKVFTQHQLPWEVAETLVTWGALLMRRGKAEEGAAKLDTAAHIYRQLNLGPAWDDRIEGLRASAEIASAPSFDSSATPSGTAHMVVQAAASIPSSGIHALVTTQDVALLATLIHDAIAHLMNAIDKASKLRAPIERIAAATEEIGRIRTPIEELARVLGQGGRTSAQYVSPSYSPGGRPGRSRRQKLNRGHDPGRPL